MSDAGSSARQTRAARKDALVRIRHQLDGSLDQEIKGLMTLGEREGQARGRDTRKKPEKRDDPDYSASDSEQSVTSAPPSDSEVG